MSHKFQADISIFDVFVRLSRVENFQEASWQCKYVIQWLNDIDMIGALWLNSKIVVKY